MYSIELQARDGRRAMREYRDRKRAKTLWFRSLRAAFLFFAGIFADTAEIRKNTISVMLVAGVIGSTATFV